MLQWFFGTKVERENVRALWRERCVSSVCCQKCDDLGMVCAQSQKTSGWKGCLWLYTHSGCCVGGAHTLQVMLGPRCGPIPTIPCLVPPSTLLRSASVCWFSFIALHSLCVALWSSFQQCDFATFLLLKKRTVLCVSGSAQQGGKCCTMVLHLQGGLALTELCDTSIVSDVT